jgi:hypothetical protein
MAIYKSMQFTTYECWRYELDWLLNSVWSTEFRDDYLLHKYGPVCKLQLDDEDHKALWDRFIFEITRRQPPPSSSASPE